MSTVVRARQKRGVKRLREDNMPSDNDDEIGKGVVRDTASSPSNPKTNPKTTPSKTTSKTTLKTTLDLDTKPETQPFHLFEETDDEDHFKTRNPHKPSLLERRYRKSEKRAEE